VGALAVEPLVGVVEDELGAAGAVVEVAVTAVAPAVAGPLEAGTVNESEGSDSRLAAAVLVEGEGFPPPEPMTWTRAITVTTAKTKKPAPFRHLLPALSRPSCADRRGRRAPVGAPWPDRSVLPRPAGLVGRFVM
jgi:hypothetical protein